MQGMFTLIFKNLQSSMLFINRKIILAKAVYKDYI